MSKKLSLLFPVGEEFTDKKTYLAAVSKDFKKEFKGFKIEDREISQLFGIALKGEELADDAAPEHVKMLTHIKTDIEQGKADLASREQAEAAEGSKEAQLIASITEVDDASIASAFSKKFVLGPNGLVAKGEVTDKDILGALAFAFGSESRSQWMVGDAVVMLEDRGLENVVIQACAMFKRAYPTVSGYARTARAVPADRRRHLDFTVYQEVACARLEGTDKKVESIREAILAEAEEKLLSAKEVREIVKEKQGKKDKAVKPDYLIVSKDGEGFAVKLVADEPGYEEGVMVIHLPTRTVLGEVEKEGGRLVIDWAEIAAE